MCGRRHRIRRAGAAVAALAGLACGDAVAPATRVCAEILALQIPAAELVEAWPGAHGAALSYRVEGEEVARVHRLECLIAEDAPGRLRARSLRVDDRELSEAEILLVNSELLLSEIRRADPGPPRRSHWPLWIEATLSRLREELFSVLHEWGLGRSREAVGGRERARAGTRV